MNHLLFQQLLTKHSFTKPQHKHTSHTMSLCQEISFPLCHFQTRAIRVLELEEKEHSQCSSRGSLGLWQWIKFLFWLCVVPDDPTHSSEQSTVFGWPWAAPWNPIWCHSQTERCLGFKSGGDQALHAPPLLHIHVNNSFLGAGATGMIFHLVR